MNRRDFFATIAALLFGTTARPKGRYVTAKDAIVYRGYRIPRDQCVITFSRDPQKFKHTHYGKYVKVTQ